MPVPRRKKAEEEHENHERWLVSYADFITLLFAFFVMMYSISSVNEGKYRVLSESMVTAFSSITESSSDSSAAATKEIIAIGTTPKMLAPAPAIKPVDSKETKTATAKKSASELKKSLRKQLSSHIDKGRVRVEGTNKYIEIEISSSILFRSGGASLSPQAVKILEPLVYDLLGTTKPIYVFGYTDNVPIYTEKYASNWELSAARAVSVVRVFASLGIDPEIMGAVGYGEHRPLADNNTEEGKRRNRRVVIRVYTGDDVFSE